MQCSAIASDVACVDGSGTPITRTAGAATTTYTDPFGQLALDPVTAAKLPVVPGFAALATAYGGSSSTIYFGNTSAAVVGASIQPEWDYRPTGGSAVIARDENQSQLDARYLAANAATTAGSVYGWSIDEVTYNSVSTVLTARTPDASATDTVPAMVAGTGQTFRFNQDPPAFGPDVGFGSFRSVTVYDQDQSSSFAQIALNATGLVLDATNPITFSRSSPAWAPPWVTSARAERYAAGMPVVTTRGLELHAGASGERPQATGWILDNATSGLGRKGLDASTWATVGAVTVATDVAAGLFASFSGNATSATEMDEIRDATAGTTDKMTLGILTDGTVGVPCSTWTRARDGALVTTLTATPEFYTCTFPVTGVPTSVKGEVFVGTASTNGVKGTLNCSDSSGTGKYVVGVVARSGLTGTGSIIVEAPTCSIYDLAVPLPDSVALAQDRMSVTGLPLTLIPTGQTAAGATIKVVFYVDDDVPDVYVWNTSDGAAAETKLLMLETGAVALNPDGTNHAATDVFVRSGWRSTLYNATCAGGTFNNGGTDITSQGTLGTFPRGTRIVESLQIVHSGSIAGVPRVNQIIRLDTCPTGLASDCDATTIVASNMSGTMCASDTTDAATYWVWGSRASGATVASANNPMNGAIAYTEITSP